MAHYDVVLDLGYDYGADGGLAWDTQIALLSSGASRRNQLRSNALGAWQLGQRRVDKAELEYLQGFMHAMRGRLHTFLYRAWDDYEAENEQLALDGSDTTQLIKTYGLDINGWTRDIRKLKADSVTIEKLVGAAWEAVEEDTDYTLDDSTGVVTWTVAPDTSDSIRWSGEFYVPVRFDRDVVPAQFIGYEEAADGTKRRAYEIGDLSVVEDPEA